MLYKAIVFDPVTNQYVFSEKVGQIDFRPPSSMSVKEYLQYDRQTAVQNYWQEKSRERIEAAAITPAFQNQDGRII